MNRENAKKILKIVAFIYVASFLIINWNAVSWIFNYKEVSGLVSDFFNPYPSIDASVMDVYFYPNHSSSQVSFTPQNSASQNLGGQGGQAPEGQSQEITVSQPVNEIKTNYTDKINTLEVPKISISVPIVFATSTNNSVLHKQLDSGVVYYPGSVYPGQTGQIVILGHSAPLGWPHIKYDWAFTDLDKLEPGDNIFIDLNNKQYTYVVKQKMIIKRGADVPTEGLDADNNILTLISCWPPGKDYQRIAVVSELVGG